MKSLFVRYPFAFLLISVFVLGTLLSSLTYVGETDQAIKVRLGNPVATVNRYNPDDVFGNSGAGLAFRVPFVEEFVKIDKRVRDLDMERQQVLSTDQRRLQVDAFARYRVVDPLRMFIAAQTEERVEAALQPILGSQLRNELGKRPYASLLSPEREGAMENIRVGLNRIARQYGVEIIDVRIKKAELPDGAPLTAAYERMRTARLQEARSIRAQGQKQGQIIRAEADAQAARTYAEAYGKDADFYDFYRAMQSYRQTFVKVEGQDKGQTNIVMSPSNDYLREFTGN
ncbi:protease modulator HflC [Sphingomicrobium marinum]|uniref:protease modulator HflC n=1 Tax=Sphingomicrobium marinum TaxID=1227950 RepID=UPI00223EF81F|nr:protease modulator HflC [Sphingomicrobium marinum]